MQLKSYWNSSPHVISAARSSTETRWFHTSLTFSFFLFFLICLKSVGCLDGNLSSGSSRDAVTNPPTPTGLSIWHCERTTAVRRDCSGFPHSLSLSYLSLLFLYLPSSSSLSPLLKRLSSAVRWRSYRPLAARLLNCQQLWDERISVRLLIAASAGPDALKWDGWFVLAGHRRPREIRHKLFCVSQMSSWGFFVAVNTYRYNVMQSERLHACRIMTTTGIHDGFHSSCEVVADAPREGSSLFSASRTAHHSRRIRWRFRNGKYTERVWEQIGRCKCGWREMRFCPRSQ